MHDASGADKAPFDELVSWKAERLSDDLSVDVLAARVAMSPRNFARRFILALKILRADMCKCCGSRLHAAC